MLNQICLNGLSVYFQLHLKHKIPTVVVFLLDLFKIPHHQWSKLKSPMPHPLSNALMKNSITLQDFLSHHSEKFFQIQSCNTRLSNFSGYPANKIYNGKSKEASASIVSETFYTSLQILPHRTNH